ncbi:efflux RND transporter periplasmic adaptor subunit [Luteibacter pinisoli]|uniref:Efflux RND transporter periplasmic adaptor subunit n=1 Tax=Luteibacter pinisoli TaxID=2589080 RepID=A0A4Y5Z5J6_9GAMM|nr:efflux RND transporter periplasmic adaptor subunit [Luteibacter pinisoli]QDE39839.1 efflux RND transporter periplasmic adaptor subunit [Luteibacter pinisoli]
MNRKPTFKFLAAGVAIALAVATPFAFEWTKGGGQTAVAADALPAPEVDVAPVIVRPVAAFESYSGRLEAIDHVDIKPQVAGAITAVRFRDGQLVKKGDPLFVIDPRPYTAEVDRAAAQVAVAKARSGYTTTDADRAKRLIEDHAISRRDFDLAQNASREADAGLKAAEAALEVARVNAGYTTINAPVTGRVSRAEVTLGNIVSPGAGAPVLATIVSVSPIYASFDVDEQTYLGFFAKNQGDGIAVELGLSSEQAYSRKGAIDSVDNQVDTRSGTIRVRARFDNQDGALLPGLYARVRVAGGQTRDAVLVEDGAIGTDQDKKFVLVVGADNKAEYREVTVGALYGTLRVVTNGLKPDERIVVNGLQRAQPGATVKANVVAMTPAKPAA